MSVPSNQFLHDLELKLGVIPPDVTLLVKDVYVGLRILLDLECK